MQLEFFDVPSPCVSICQADEKGYCLGCLRTRAERQTWKALSNDDKQKVIKRCRQRKKRKTKQTAQQNHPELQPEAVLETNLDSDLQPSLLDPPIKVKTQDDEMNFDDFDL